MPIKAKYNGSYKDITDLMNVDESIDYVLAKTSSSYKRVYTATRSIEDAPPTTFKSIKSGANLTDYRIYGQTVDGESVGDRTGNLFDETIYNKNVQDNMAIYVPIYVGNIDYVTCSTTCPKTITSDKDSFNSRYIFILSGNVNTGAQNAENGVSNGAPRTIQPSNGYVTICYRKIENYNIRPWEYQTMLNVGSTPLPYEPYGYKVPVTVEGKNLFDEIYLGIDNRVHYRAIYVGTGFFTLSSDIAIFSNTTNLFLLSGNVSSGASSTVNGVGYGVPKSVESIDGYITIGYRNLNEIDPSNYKTMLNTGTSPYPYEPYQPPVTANLYLPEQIKKVGDEAEYIDYGEQKFVKKFYKITLNFDDMNNDETFPGWSNVTAVVEYCNKIRPLAIDNPDSYTPLQYSSINEFRAIFNVRGNRSILYLGTSFDIGHTQSELKEIYAGQSITFILKIPDTDVNVTLPALPTVRRTNVLSVGTEVQPSKIDITGHIKTISGGS